MWVTDYLSGMNKLVPPWKGGQGLPSSQGKARTWKLVTLCSHLCHLDLEQDAPRALGLDVSSCKRDTVLLLPVQGARSGRMGGGRGFIANDVV